MYLNNEYKSSKKLIDWFWNELEVANNKKLSYFVFFYERWNLSKWDRRINRTLFEP